ncbi:MAG: DNA-binding protein [Methanomassiliicoccales archaeon]|nr:DNA-binding protein [Methanomassiliicoccales archaeon]
MKHCEARQGRIFVIRLEDGEIIHESLEKFAFEHGISSAVLIFVGGAQSGTVVVGPSEPQAGLIVPMLLPFSEAHELLGVGTIFLNENGYPVSHIHGALGRNGDAIVGCLRKGVETWKVIEVILIELTDADAIRKVDPDTGFELLDPGKTRSTRRENSNLQS